MGDKGTGNPMLPAALHLLGKHNEVVGRSTQADTNTHSLLAIESTDPIHQNDCESALPKAS